MALVLDGGSPISVWANATSVASGAFTPPLNSLVIIWLRYNTGSGDAPGTPTITDSLGVHLSYTLVEHARSVDAPIAADGAVAVWSAVATQSTSMTITTGSTGTAATGSAIKVQVWTDDTGGTPGTGVTAKGGSSSGATSVALNLLATKTGSRGLIGVEDWNAGGAPTAGTGCTVSGGDSVDQGSTLSYCVALRSANDGVAGVNTVMNVTFGAITSDVRWLGLEITPAPVVATAVWESNGPGMVAPTGTFQNIAVVDDPAITTINADAEQTTHDVVAADPAAGVGATDTAPATTHTAGTPTAALSLSDTPPALTHQTGDVSATSTTTDGLAPATSHTTGAPTPGVSVAAGDAATTHQTFDATVSTTSVVNVNAELTNHTVAAGDVSATQTTQAETTSHAQVAQDALAALALPPGMGTTSHSAGDPQNTIAVAATAGATTHTTGDPTVTSTTGAGGAATTHTTYDATVSNATIVNADAQDLVHAQTTGDPTSSINITTQAGAATHQTFDASISTTQAAVDVTNPAQTQTANAAAAGVGDSAPFASHSVASFDVASIQTTLAGLLSIAHQTFDATVSTALAPPAFVAVDSGLNWSQTVDRPYTTGALAENITTPSTDRDTTTRTTNVDGISTPTGLVG